MAAEVPQTHEYRGGQLNAAPLLEVENFTNYKKRFMCHINESELASLFGKLEYEENLIDSIYETEKKKSLVSVTPLSTTFISTSTVQDFQDSHDIEDDTRSNQEYIDDLEEEYQAKALLAKSKRFFKKGTQRFSGAKATGQSEYHKCGRKGHFARGCFSKTLVPSFSSPFQNNTQTRFTSPSQHKPELRPNKDFEAKYNKVKARLALLSSGASASNSTQVKNKGLITKTYEWDEEEVSSDENEVDEVKVLMALTDDERVAVGKESAKNGEWVKISMKKVHTLLEMEDNDDRKYFLDYLCIDLNYVEEQRNNILSKHRDIVHELNTCKEQLIVLKQAKLDFLTMQHVNTEILKKNQNLRKELKELTNITETWFNSSNKVNQCISEQIPTQKKRILRVDQLTEDPSSSGQKDVVFVKSSADDTKVSTLESQVNTTDPPAAVTNSSGTEYDSADEFSVCSTPLPPLEKLAGAELVFRPKTIKSILKSNYTFKAEALKGITINEPSSAPAKAKASTSKTNSAPTGKLKNVKTKDDLPLASVMKELSDLKLQMSKNQSFYSRNNKSQQYERTDHRTCDHADYMSSMNISSDHLSNDCVNYPICDLCRSYDHDTHGHNKIISLRRGINPRNPQHAIKSCETYGSTVHTTTNHNDIEWFRRGEALQAKKAKTLKSKKTESSNANRTKTPTKRHITGVKSYLHKYVEQLGSKFDEKRGTIFNSNKEIVMIAPRVRDIYVLNMTSSEQESCFFAKSTENINWLWHKRLAHLNFKTINKLAKQNLVIGLYSLVYSKDKPCSSCEKGKHHRASFKTKQISSIKKCLHLLHMDLFGPIIPRSINHERYTFVIVDEYSRSTIVKRHLKTPYEIFHGRIQNIDFLYVFGCPVYIHNHKDYLGKFDEKADDDYLLGYSLVSKTSRFFNTRRQPTEETYHITFNESTYASKFTKPLVDIYPLDEYLHPYEPSQRYQTNSNDVSFIEPYERPDPVVLKTKVPSDQNDQTDNNNQNDHPAQTDEIFNDNQSDHSNHNNDDPIIDNLTNTKDVQNPEPTSSLDEDSLILNIIAITIVPSSSIPSIGSPVPQDRWSQDKHIELVNSIGDLGAGILTRAMAKELSAASAHECLFADFLSEKESKKVSEALKHPG
ncbi:retrovirus-related pol polyprotein from transposon TNT 1-94 [Tanacetum coccineum]